MARFRFVLGALALLHASAMAQGAHPFIYSPYKHLAMWQDASLVVRLAGGPYIVDGKPRVSPGTLTWACATGECGDEKWGAIPGQKIADANVVDFDKAGVQYMISTGGQGGVFTCATEEGMELFIKRYESARLIGIDFDIEAGQTATQAESLIKRIKTAQARRPHLRYSFTVATHAGSDGKQKSLNRQGEMTLAAIRRNGLAGYTLNLMVMATWSRMCSRWPTRACSRARHAH